MARSLSQKVSQRFVQRKSHNVLERIFFLAYRIPPSLEKVTLFVVSTPR